MPSIYVERRYCMTCVCVHWVEVTRAGNQICHGEDLQAAESATHYVKRKGRGMQIIQRRTLAKPRKNNKEATL